MSLASLVRGAFRRVPASMRATVTLRARDGRTTTGTAIGIPTPGERLSAGQSSGQSIETFSLLPDGLAFAPVPGMRLERGTQQWTVIDVALLRPGAGTPALYRLGVTR